MKTPPDETTLTLWMDGQLTGTELESMEAWAQLSAMPFRQ